MWQKILNYNAPPLSVASLSDRVASRQSEYHTANRGASRDLSG